MKAGYFFIMFGSFCACAAEEPNPFTPQPLRLEQSSPAPAPLLGEPPKFRLDLPVGPVRIDYGFPLQKDRFRSGERNWGPLAT
jgi:outer membrane protein assembly factor BamA